MNNTSSGDREHGCDVVVVDDDADILHLLVSHIKEKGIRVKGLRSGVELADIIASERPRLLLLDVLMPVFNGYALYDSIKEETARIGTRVYFISALPERNLKWSVQTSGAAGYITKPFSMADIDAVLAEAGISAGSR
nr:response regulator [Candidatus Sigynarchaeum springense]